MDAELSDHNLLVRIDERVTHISAEFKRQDRRITRLEWASAGLVGFGGLLGWIISISSSRGGILP